MTVPQEIQPYWHAMQTISSESGVPASRIGGHVIIESNGDARAIQRNNQNGWSYGLMQIVPFTADPQRQGWEGHHALVRQIAGLPATATRQQVIDALYDPVTNLRVGCAILADLKRGYGSWDKASSAFFLGNPDWRGADTVNGNTGTWYRDALNDWIVKIEAGEGTPVTTMIRFAGTSVDVPLDVPFRKVILPASQTRQRPGIFMDAAVYVQHETGNANAGANADMHLRYLQNGAEGQQLGYHFTVDEKEAIQMIPVNEVTWHGGDGGGQCNYTGVSCELCVQDNNAHKTQARENAERLAAAVMLATNVTRLIQHSDCCAAIGNPAGCHSNCPQYIRQDHYWGTFVQHVQSLMAGTTPGPVITYAVAQPPPPWDNGSDAQVGNISFRAAQRQYAAKSDGVKVFQWADTKSAELRSPLKKGEVVLGLYLVKGADGADWIVTNFGSRVRASDLTPRVTIQD